jgi:hypothetical protein
MIGALDGNLGFLRLGRRPRRDNLFHGCWQSCAWLFAHKYSRYLDKEARLEISLQIAGEFYLPLLLENNYKRDVPRMPNRP